MDLTSLLFPLLILLLFIPIFLSGRRQRQQMQEMQALQTALEPGDVVMTTSGLRGTVVDASYEETVDLEIADGVVTTWVRAAVKNKVPAEPAAPVGRERRAGGGRAGADRRSRPSCRSRRPSREPSTPSLQKDDSTNGTGRAVTAGHLTTARPSVRKRSQPWQPPRGGSVPGATWPRSSASSSCCTRWCSSPATAGPRPSWASTCRAAPGSRWWPAPRPGPNRPASSSLQAQQIIEERVNGLGVSGAEVVLDGTNLTITVPGQEGEQARSLGPDRAAAVP